MSSATAVPTIVTLYRSGMSMADVADECGCGIRRVQIVLDRYGVAHPKRVVSRRPDVDKAAVVAAYRAGETARVVARRHGIGETTVCDWVRRAGCTVRPGGHHRAPLSESVRAAIIAQKGKLSARIVSAHYGVTMRTVYDVWRGDK